MKGLMIDIRRSNGLLSQHPMGVHLADEALQFFLGNDRLSLRCFVSSQSCVCVFLLDHGNP